MNEGGDERGCEGSICWILRVSVVTLRDSFLTFVFLLLHRCWHQELLQKDWLQVTRPVHGKDAEIMATTVCLDAVSLARERDSRCLDCSPEAAPSKCTTLPPWQEVSPSPCTCGERKLLSGQDLHLGTKRGVPPSAHSQGVTSVFRA